MRGIFSYVTISSGLCEGISHWEFMSCTFFILIQRVSLNDYPSIIRVQTTRHWCCPLGDEKEHDRKTSHATKELLSVRQNLHYFQSRTTHYILQTAGSRSHGLLLIYVEEERQMLRFLYVHVWTVVPLGTHPWVCVGWGRRGVSESARVCVLIGGQFEAWHGRSDKTGPLKCCI